MKRSLLLITVFLPAALTAQTSVNFLEIPADWGMESTYWAVADTVAGIPINLGTPGGGNIWNYDYLDSTNNFAQTITDGDETPYGTSFPNANLVMESEDLSQFGLAGPGYMYYNLTTTSLQLQGLGVEMQGQALPVVFQNPVNWLTLPLDYNDAWNSNMFYQFFFDSAGMNYRIDLEGTFSERADAYGTLNIPLGSYQALRVKNNISITYTVYVIIFGIPIEVMSESISYIAYMWIADNLNMCALVMSQQGETNPNFTTASTFATLAEITDGLYYANATPVNPPVIIPPGGGSFSLLGSIHNNQGQPGTLQFWSGVYLPNGNFYGPILQRNLTLPPGGSLSRNLNQMVPASAPAGTYYYVLCLGDFAQNEIQARGGFMFTKQNNSDSEISIGDWPCTGFDDELSSSAIPQDYSLLSAYPNPFNAQTNITFTLPASGDIALKVFDLQGRETATLAEGYYPQGSNSVVWNAADCASGVYFVKLQTDNSQSAVRKVVLIK